MLPKTVPSLTKKQVEFLRAELERQPTPDEVNQSRQAKAIYEKLSARSKDRD